MATIRVSSGVPFSLNNFVAHNLLDGLSYTWTSNFYKVDYGNGVVDQFFGTGFKTVSATDPAPTAGLVTRYQAVVSGVVKVDVSGISLDAVSLYKAAQTASTADDLALYVAELQGNDRFYCNSGNDYVNALGGADWVDGGAGNDVILGATGNDILLGGAGNDSIDGGDHNDLITGGLGRDVLTGGLGADRFDFNAITETGKTATTRDVIRDFTHNNVLTLSDRIDLSTIDANGAAAGDAAFSYLAAKGAAFTGVKGQLHWYQVDSTNNALDRTFIEGDIDGNRVADFQIELIGLKNLVIQDFIL